MDTRPFAFARDNYSFFPTGETNMIQKLLTFMILLFFLTVIPHCGGNNPFTGGDHPDVVTTAATSITATHATLNGIVNPKKLPCKVWFSISTNYNLVSEHMGADAINTPGQEVDENLPVLPFSQTLTVLSPDTTYYYQAVLQDEILGHLYAGGIVSFTTGT